MPNTIEGYVPCTVERTIHSNCIIAFSYSQTHNLRPTKGDATYLWTRETCISYHMAHYHVGWSRHEWRGTIAMDWKGLLAMLLSGKERQCWYFNQGLQYRTIDKLVEAIQTCHIKHYYHKSIDRDWPNERTFLITNDIWLSKPLKILYIPFFTPDKDGFKPCSVLLLLAGTGIVVLPQILAHRGYFFCFSAKAMCRKVPSPKRLNHKRLMRSASFWTRFQQLGRKQTLLLVASMTCVNFPWSRPTNGGLTSKSPPFLKDILRFLLFQDHHATIVFPCKHYVSANDGQQRAPSIWIESDLATGIHN